MYLQHFKYSWASSSIVWSVILISSAFSLLIFTAFAWNNVLQLPVFFLLFLLSSGITDFENHLICWIEAVFPKYSCKIWWKNWYFHSHIKTYDHQIWQAVTYRPVDSSGTNQQISHHCKITQDWLHTMRSFFPENHKTLYHAVVQGHFID